MPVSTSWPECNLGEVRLWRRRPAYGRDQRRVSVDSGLQFLDQQIQKRGYSPRVALGQGRMAPGKSEVRQVLFSHALAVECATNNRSHWNHRSDGNCVEDS
jgi:hypothetical protein